MGYSIKEIYYTIQGEGANTGRAAVFCRFAGCNLWTGREEDRTKAICDFCDTDFLGTDGPGGGTFKTARDVVLAVKSHWPTNGSPHSSPFVVCTGGEPLLQLDEPLVGELHRAGFQISIETNGTMLPPEGIDWICVSPKAGAEFVLKTGNELKLVYPQKEMDPQDFIHLDFAHFFIQPMDGPQRDENTKLAVEYCLRHPQWRLSLQTHKYLGIN
jgi:7-carboxy-7-deazaguanine synthase